MIDYYSVDPYASILSVLGKGEENAIPAGKLCRLVDMEERELRFRMEELRKIDPKRLCICSSNRGYFLPKTRKDAEAWRGKLVGIRNKYAELAKAVDEYLLEIDQDQQMKLPI